MVMPQPDPWMSRPGEVTRAPYPSPEPPPEPLPEEDEEEETAGFWERWAKKWFQLEPGQTWWDKYSPLLGFTPPTGEGPVELVPGAIDFETIITSPVLTVEQKTDLVEGFHPDRLAEAIEILANPAYDIPSVTTPTEEALAQFLVSEGGVGEVAAPSFPTEPPPEGYVWDLNEYNQWVPVYVGSEAVADFGEEPEGRFYTDDAGNLHQVSYVLTSRGWDQQDTIVQFEQREPLPTGEADWQREQRLWQQQQAQQQYELQQQQAAQQAQYQQQQLEQQAQWQAWQQGEAQRQYGAQLAAQPASWLQYAAYTGEQPAIQPWMLPLMPQQYQQLGAGQAIPGWQAPQAGQMDGFAQGTTGLPQLTRPSRQYQARMGPTASQQYLGYQQARTGARPEETQFRLWSAAPPGGQYQGLRYTR